MSLFQIIFMIGQILILTLILIHNAPIMAWVERRGAALMQNRLGPNRIGPLGLFQSAADGIKFIFKEDQIPGHVSKFYYVLAPLVSLVPSFLTFAVIPYGSQIDLGGGQILKFQIADLNVGILFTLAIASLGVYGIIMSGWASNSKYAMMGSLRSSSQMISYELSMGLSLVGILMVFSSVKLGDIAAAQGQTLLQLGPIALPKWGIFIQPLGFLIFMTSVFAETNRLPFDLPEGESEIVAGYHLEYGSMKFAILQMAEYNNMLTGSGLLATLYFGGWQMLFPLGQIYSHLALSGMTADWVRVAFEIGSFTVKVLFFMWFFVWVRWTLPRFRYDQLMDLGWKVMLPLSLVNLFITAVMISYGVI
ncbi:MAG: NADH-quinone oxidoreductase subunit NuoH [Oligoflexia bacterium]|nr:NADH-quinone oxidoreductase subunit NuoH [Oligoflexia bacterium]